MNLENSYLFNLIFLDSIFLLLSEESFFYTWFIKYSH